MNKIANLTDKPSKDVESILSKLEEMSGYHSEDVRLLAEATQALRAKITQLNLDPDDTTGEELYHALIARYHNDAAKVDGALGIEGSVGVSERIATAAKLVNQIVESNEVWAIKNAAAKDLLRFSPPRKLMKNLGYRSLDSLLKREDVAAILIAADTIELPTWRKKVTAKISKLDSTNYELRAARVVELPEKLVGHNTDEAVTVHGLTGAVAIWPASLSVTTPVLTIALMLIDGLSGLGEQPIEHKLHHVNPVLGWWFDTEHLISLHGNEAVSLNVKDVANNHLASKPYENRAKNNGHQALWNHLMQRYKNYLDELPGDVLAAETKVKILRPNRELVPELIEVGE